MLCKILILGAAWVCVSAQGGGEAPNPTKSPAGHFDETGTFEQVLRQLAIQLRPETVIGFVKHSGAESKLTISVERATAGEVIGLMCSRDPRYKLLDSHSPHVLNVVPADNDNPRYTALLNLRLERLDIVADDWPRNLFFRLAEFSPEVRTFLAKWHQEDNKFTEPVGSPGANMTGSVRSPHVEMHFQGLTVRESLNGISEWTIARASAGDLALPQGVILWPEGWKCEAAPAQRTPLDGWMRSIVSAFP